ncbi:7689_t:CDS:2 [Racocetra persica]|uniref:7689_t:CDS:1 n=1 Tax=Racocetra persica TaxID=160502 RepID=A0ACA9R266_9GLOM|nr:7689_t:CDS:2 [Racocetra persica]
MGFGGIFERNGDEKKVVGSGGNLELKPETKVYYTSSGAEVKNEVKQIKPLIEQIVGEKAAKNIQIIEGPKQKNGYDCGVYLIKYIEELLRVGRLELNKVADKWCKWDAISEGNIKGNDQAESEKVDSQKRETEQISTDTECSKTLLVSPTKEITTKETQNDNALTDAQKTIEELK